MKQLWMGLGALALSGCVSMNPVTLVRLATLDPFTADPTQMAVRMDLPEGVGVAHDSGFVRLQAMPADGEGFNERFLLVGASDEVWRIDPDARDRFRAAQARAVAWEQADAEGSSGGFTVGFLPCTQGDGPAEDAVVSLYIQLEPAAAFLPLFTDAAVHDLMDDSAVDGLEACALAD